MYDEHLFEHSGMCTDGNKVWYMAEKLGLPVEIDMNGATISTISNIPYNEFRQDAYRRLYYEQESSELYFLPYMCNKMYVYDIEKKIIEKRVLLKKDNQHFMAASKLNNKIYIYGKDNVVAKYDPDSGTMGYIELNYEQLGLEKNPLNWFYFQGFVIDNNLYIPMEYSNCVVKISDKDEISLLKMGEKEEFWRECNMYKAKDGIRGIFTDDEGNIKLFGYDIEKGKLKSYDVILKEPINAFICKDKIPFRYSGYANNKWLIFPARTNKMYSIDENGGELECVYEFLYHGDMKNNVLDSDTFMFTCGISKDEYIYAVSGNGGSIIRINLCNETIEEKKIRIDEGVIEAFFERGANLGVVKENRGVFTLEYLINSLSEKIC